MKKKTPNKTYIENGWVQLIVMENLFGLKGLTFYSIITPFDAFEIFSKVFKSHLKFFLNFSMLSKNRNDVII